MGVLTISKILFYLASILKFIRTRKITLMKKSSPHQKEKKRGTASGFLLCHECPFHSNEK